MVEPPRKILLATDLSARSDRAQDRAVSLMKHYGARLIVLHVIEASREIGPIGRIPFVALRRPSDERVNSARMHLFDYMGEVGPQVDVRIEEGVPHEVIMRVSRQEGCDLIVTGVARNEVLGRFTMGRTVNRLLRLSDTDMLVVTERVRSHYRRVIVLVDFNDASRRAVEKAAASFPGQKLRVLHAFTASRSSAVDDAQAYREQVNLVAHRDFADFLGKAELTPEQRVHVNMMVEFGTGAALLRDLAASSDMDLAVIGSPRSGLVYGALLGNRTKQIISSLPCDALVVR